MSVLETTKDFCVHTFFCIWAQALEQGLIGIVVALAYVYFFMYLYYIGRAYYILRGLPYAQYKCVTSMCLELRSGPHTSGLG